MSPGIQLHEPLQLIRAAQGLGGETWSERSRAVLLLENRLAGAGASECESILETLNIEEADRPELLKRIQRPARVRNAIARSDWDYISRAAHDVCKLALSRYLFSPQEVVDEITRHLDLSEGVAISPPPDSDRLPAYEMDILNRLRAGSPVYWVSDRCGSELNALVEYPLTSAVLVIKPPGSDLEFEVKRAGTRAARRMDVIRERNGREAPTSHRLFGGSLGWLAEREASSADLFAKIYGLVHAKDCPISRTVGAVSVVTVATAEGQSHILDYLTDPGFPETRESMKACVAAFPSDTGVAKASYEGDAGLTLQFIGQSLPQQVIISESSSYRLDRIALYLSAGGPASYFNDVPSEAALRWFADSVLEEILGEIDVPSGPFVSYEQYVADAFEISPNRKRADANYVSVMSQTGECWGTLLALRGFSDGESFVQRNVGLKSYWKDGEWKIRIVFMDHDDLTMAGSRYQYLWPQREVPGMLRDQVHVLGGPLSGDTIPGDVGALQGIFRTDADMSARGVAALETSLRDAYYATRSALDSNTELRSLFYPEFLARHRDMDTLVKWALKEPDTWTTDAARWLKEKEYSEELAAESIQAIVQFRRFFERMRFLYSDNDA